MPSQDKKKLISEKKETETNTVTTECHSSLVGLTVWTPLMGAFLVWLGASMNGRDISMVSNQAHAMLRGGLITGAITGACVQAAQCCFKRELEKLQQNEVFAFFEEYGPIDLAMLFAQPASEHLWKSNSATWSGTVADLISGVVYPIVFFVVMQALYLAYQYYQYEGEVSFSREGCNVKITFGQELEAINAEVQVPKEPSMYDKFSSGVSSVTSMLRLSRRDSSTKDIESGETAQEKKSAMKMPSVIVLFGVKARDAEAIKAQRRLVAEAQAEAEKGKSSWNPLSSLISGR